jgi:hypothetical protein
MNKVEIRISRMLPVYWLSAILFVSIIMFTYHWNVGSIMVRQEYNKTSWTKGSRPYYVTLCEYNWFQQNPPFAYLQYNEYKSSHHNFTLGDNGPYRTKFEIAWQEVTEFHLWDILYLSLWALALGCLLKFIFNFLQKRMSISFK